MDDHVKINEIHTEGIIIDIDSFGADNPDAKRYFVAYDIKTRQNDGWYPSESKIPRV